jgi:hypothetical protein
MGRDRKKGKGGGRGAGGGHRMFIDNVEELQKREAQLQEHRDARLKRRGEEGEGGANEAEEDEDEEEEGGEVSFFVFVCSLVLFEPCHLIRNKKLFLIWKENLVLKEVVQNLLQTKLLSMKKRKTMYHVVY